MQNVEDDDKLTFTPLGAGQEVGRSCHILKYKGTTIMLDCGIHPGKQGFGCLPYMDHVDASTVDLLLITHFHLDHCAALPYYLKQGAFKGQVYMTHATKAISALLLADLVRINNIGDQPLYDQRDLDRCMERVQTVDFHQETTIGAVKFTPYYAGHVLGAAMFLIEIAGVKILYTGDYSREDDRHLMAAEIPPVVPDVLVTESTYGVHEHESMEKREARFTSAVHDIVTRGGKCLIPVFALGRAQELLLILDEYWQAHPELQEFRVFYASELANKCMNVFKRYVNCMNQRVRSQMRVSNPFVFKHIQNIRGNNQDELNAGPCVVMASPGMLQNGLSRELCEQWAPDRRNGLVIAGYSVSGTLANDLLKEPVDFMGMAGDRIDRKMSVTYVSFSAHVDYKQNRDFINQMNPSHVILVHGERNEMDRFMEAFIREKEETVSDSHISMNKPGNTETVELRFSGDKTAKVIGAVAMEAPKAGHTVSGVLVKKTLSYRIVAPTELQAHTDLKTMVLTQRQAVRYNYTFSLLQHYLGQLYGRAAVELLSTEEGVAQLVVMGIVRMQLNADARMLVLEWQASPENDMWADAVLGVVLQIESSPSCVRLASSLEDREDAAAVPMDTHADVDQKFKKNLIRALKSQFGVCEEVEGSALVVRVDEREAHITLATLDVTSTDATLRQSVASTVKRAQALHQDHHGQHSHCHGHHHGHAHAM